MLWLCVIWIVLGTSLAAIPADEVTYLPGLDVQPTFKHYSGYLNTTDSKALWYWFVESENDPANDPVVLWLNGGPGCSSMTGKLTEIGPWRSHSNGSLTWFEHRWNKIANVIFFDSPQCVGHSYTEDWETPGYCFSDDDLTAQANHLALKEFFAGFPELAANEFFVTGESYGGVYVPTLSALVMDDPELNFQGMAIDNGVNDDSIQNSGLVEFLWARGVFGIELYNDLTESCCPGNNATKCMFATGEGADCAAANLRVQNLAWNSGMNPYAMYQECWPSAPNRTTGIVWETETEVMVVIPDGLPMYPGEWKEFQKSMEELRASGKTIYSGIPCTDTSNRDNYLHRADVRDALHVPSYVPLWEACSDHLSYNKLYPDVRDAYYKVLGGGHRVVIFYGDTDIACNHHGARWFAESLEQPGETPYDEWNYETDSGSNQVAGFKQEWDNFKFVTVKGAGHMVPTDAPKRGYVIFEKFLNNAPYS